MQSFSKYCIFCSKALSDTERKGRGEHIVPEYLNGSFCIKVVCEKCNKTLGAEVDCLALEDPGIISAILALDLPELQARIVDRATHQYAIGEAVVPVKLRKGEIRGLQHGKEVFFVDERVPSIYLRSRIRKYLPEDVHPDEVEEIVQELATKRARAKPGESISDERLGITLRRIPGELITDWKTSAKACERLIAKIGYEIAYLTFDPERIDSTPVLKELALAAMGKGTLTEGILLYAEEVPEDPQYYHEIVVRYGTFVNIIDIRLFGCVQFRLCLTGNRPCKPPLEELEALSLVMMFQPNQMKRKMLCKKHLGTSEPEVIDVTGYV